MMYKIAGHLATVVVYTIYLLRTGQRHLVFAELHDRLAVVLHELVHEVCEGRVGRGSDAGPDAEASDWRAGVYEAVDGVLVESSAREDLYVLETGVVQHGFLALRERSSRSPLSSRTARRLCPADSISSATVMAF